MSNPVASADDVVEPAVRLVENWLRRAKATESREERRLARRLTSLISDPDGIDFTMRFVDRVARPEQPAAAAHQLATLGDEGKPPEFLSLADKVMFNAGATIAERLPGVVIPLANRRMRSLVGHLVVDSDPDEMRRHFSKRRAEGYDLNVNLLGEAVLGDAEAERKLRANIEMLRQPDIDYVSVKVSSIVPHLNLWAYDETVADIVAHLDTLYRAAATAHPPTFINLDMEEYHDLELTIAAFTEAMDEPEFASLTAGIVLQTYLPDAFDALTHITDWANRRHERGGGETKIRLVKGANLAMEQVDAAMHGWELATYPTKAGTDANYKKCVDWILDPARLDGVRVGIASHNLFDIAWSHLLAEARGVADRVDVEMLEGMGPAQARTVDEDVGNVLLYTPIVGRDDFDVAISYLFRRLEENSEPGNFMRVIFELLPGTPEFAEEAEKFRRSVAERDTVEIGRRRRSTRDPMTLFENEPETDPTDPEVRALVRQAVVSTPLPVQSPRVADETALDEMFARARNAQEKWKLRTPQERRDILWAAADELASRRYDLLTAQVHEASKTVAEALPEINEAIDFARYYGEQALRLEAVDDAEFEPHGVVAVIPPWNFPVAIPTGGVIASLAAGNAVLFKPSHETRRCAEIVAEACWEAGVPRDVLQFLNIDSRDIGRKLVTGSDAVILTGSIETADLFQSWKPSIDLYAETSGKNALIVTPFADMDLAVADLVRSAFGHAGQKCSAASLGILVGDVYDSERFRRQLVDAAASLIVGPASELTTTMNPVISAVGGKLAQALTQLDPGEQWLLEPKPADESGTRWSPGIKMGVRPGSWFHQTECFGPVLGLMRAEDLEEAIDIQNGVPFGLTGGIHSLDPAEIDRWMERVEVGNAYINRHITGAIVQRQPFGGWKQSSVGPGLKAGGPNYLLQLGTWTSPGERNAEWLDRARASDERWWSDEFALEHDPTGLFCESNVLRYLPIPRVGVWGSPGHDPTEMERVLHAARTSGTNVFVLEHPSQGDLVAALGSVDIERVRVVGRAGDELRSAANERRITVIDAPVTTSGRLEMLWFLREQAVSRTLHRFGNLVGQQS